MTGPVRISCTEYVRRHVARPLNLNRQAILQHIASQADSRGRARTLQRFLAEDCGVSLITVKRHMAWMLHPDSGPVLVKGGNRTYVVVGYASHDPSWCGNIECQADVSSAQRDVSERKRALARERARRYRERKAAERP